MCARLALTVQFESRVLSFSLYWSEVDSSSERSNPSAIAIDWQNRSIIKLSFQTQAESLAVPRVTGRCDAGGLGQVLPREWAREAQWEAQGLTLWST